MNQYVRKTDTVTFGGLTVNGNSNTTGTATVASLQISGTSTAGAGCATTGLTSKTASGQLLTCQGGVFKLDGDYCASGTFMSGGSCVNISSAVRQADCPTGYIASGGSCIVIPNQAGPGMACGLYQGYNGRMGSVPNEIVHCPGATTQTVSGYDVDGAYYSYTGLTSCPSGKSLQVLGTASGIDHPGGNVFNYYFGSTTGTCM